MFRLNVGQRIAFGFAVPMAILLVIGAVAYWGTVKLIDTDGWVTTSSSAAAVTEPPRMIARNAVSCVTVIAIPLGVKRRALRFVKVSHGAGPTERRLCQLDLDLGIDVLSGEQGCAECGDEEVAKLIGRVALRLGLEEREDLGHCGGQQKLSLELALPGGDVLGCVDRRKDRVTRHDASRARRPRLRVSDHRKAPARC